MLGKTGFIAKIMLTSLFAAVTLRLGHISGLLWTFIAAVTLDYITGIMSAIYNKELKDRKSVV